MVIRALERAEITQLSNTLTENGKSAIALERAEITQLSNTHKGKHLYVIALERAEITQLSNLPTMTMQSLLCFRTSRNYTALKQATRITIITPCFRTSRNYTALKPQMFDFRVSSVLDC